MFHLLFKGNDLHSGSPPSLPLLTPEQDAEIKELISLTGPQNRVAYVSYPSTVASTRSASMSVSPPLGFWNLGTSAPHKEANRHFTDPGVSFMGTNADRAQRFGVEITLALYNALIHCGLSWEEDPEDFLTRLGYTDEDGCQRSLSGFGELHPIRGAEKIKLWLGYWKWHSQTAAQYLIFITKKQLQDHRPSSTSAVISPALFGHHQSLDEPIDQSHSATSVVEAVLGLLNTENKVYQFCFTALHALLMIP